MKSIVEFLVNNHVQKTNVHWNQNIHGIKSVKQGDWFAIDYLDYTNIVILYEDMPLEIDTNEKSIRYYMTFPSKKTYGQYNNSINFGEQYGYSNTKIRSLTEEEYQWALLVYNEAKDLDIHGRGYGIIKYDAIKSKHIKIDNITILY